MMKEVRYLRMVGSHRPGEAARVSEEAGTALVRVGVASLIRDVSDTMLAEEQIAAETREEEIRRDREMLAARMLADRDIVAQRNAVVEPRRVARA